jgi:hypothetical protein
MFTITQDLVDNRFTKVVGPRGASLSSDEIQKQGQKFRMLDDDGNIYYYGFYVETDESDELEPLDCFGMPNAGACSIEYLDSNGNWQKI